MLCVCVFFPKHTNGDEANSTIISIGRTKNSGWGGGNCFCNKKWGEGWKTTEKYNWDGKKCFMKASLNYILWWLEHNLNPYIRWHVSSLWVCHEIIEQLHNYTQQNIAIFNVWQNENNNHNYVHVKLINRIVIINKAKQA